VTEVVGVFVRFSCAASLQWNDVIPQNNFSCLLKNKVLTKNNTLRVVVVIENEHRL
jgi:hypothetical protein